MKNVILISISLVLGFTACGQKVKKEDVPASVTTKFASLYPKVQDAKWSKENVGFEAEFEVNKVEMSANFDASGNLLETETEMNVSELPASIKEYIKTKYNDAKIKEAAKIVDAKNIITYEAEVNDADLIFDAQGKFIKEIKEAEEKEAEVPAVVKTKFASLYPNVTKVKWGKEGTGFEAEFELNKVETSANFDASGNLLETETEIALSELPANVNTYIAKNIPGEKIKEASKITDAKGMVTYEAEVKGADYIFDNTGNFIKKAEEEKDAEDND